MRKALKAAAASIIKPKHVPNSCLDLKSNPDIPKNILAFRTITTLLHLIQQERQLQITKEEQMTSQDRRQLSLLNALATLAITEHNIVAVTSKDSLGGLELIASTTLPHDDITKPSSIFMNLFQGCYLFTWNPEHKKPETSTANKYPILDSPSKPAGLEGDDLKGYLEKQYTEIRPRRSIGEHLWILTKLIIQGLPLNELLNYVVATCYRKINLRLTHRWSNMYFESLASIESFGFNESDLEEVSEMEALNDQEFLTEILPSCCLELQTPNIEEQVQKQDSQPYYTAETCLEFHKVFIKLLQSFRKALKLLSESQTPSPPSKTKTPKLQDPSTSKTKTSEPQDPSTSKTGSKTKQYLFAVVLYGYALQKLSEGSILRTHLKNIEPSLQCIYDGDANSQSVPNEGKENQGREAEDAEYNTEDEARDEDLEAVKPSGDRVDVWRSYWDWLRLILVHFQAAQILFVYMDTRNRSKDISMRILIPPRVDNKLLPWQELLVDTNLFPQFPPESHDKNRTNAQILNVLEKGTKEISKWTSVLVVVKDTWKAEEVEKTIKEIKLLQASSIPGWDNTTKNLLALLENPTGNHSEITNLIYSLCDSARLFTTLKAEHKFSGALHCEASLASLISLPDIPNDASSRLLAEVKGYRPVIGTSKHCCPTCWELLRLLTRDKEAKFVVRGSHDTVTACTLPTWLPGHIVDEMNSIFGHRLRRELVELVSRTATVRKRSPSNGSDHLSIHVGLSNQQHRIISLEGGRDAREALADA